MKKRIRSSVVCIYKNKILGFDAVDPTSGRVYFFLPGGAIEEGETAAQAAVRETLEETGYKVRVDLKSVTVRTYEFFWNGEVFQSETSFFKALLDQDFIPAKSVQDADYNKGPRWLEVSKVEQTFSYHREILEAIQTFLS